MRVGLPASTTFPRLAALLLAGLALLLAAGAAHPDSSDDPLLKPGRYGKRLVMDVTLSRAELAKFAAFKPSKADPNESALINAMTAATENWTGSPTQVTPEGSPYTMVVTIEGDARADGDVATMWQSGWLMDDGSVRSQPFAGLSRNGVKAGEHVVITKSAPPTSFKSARTWSPSLGLVRAGNVDLTAVRVQLWSGMGSPSAIEWLLSFRGALVGLVMLVVAVIFLRR